MWIELQEIPNVFPGNDESVTKVNRIDVEDRHHVIVREEDLGRKLSSNDPTEHTSTHGQRGWALKVIREKSIQFCSESQRTAFDANDAAIGRMKMFDAIRINQKTGKG